MIRVLPLLLLLACACGSAPIKPPPPPARAIDPEGPHRAAVEAQLRPYLDGAVVSSVVLGLYDNGRTEVYGFGKGPGGAPPTGDTVYEIGSITKVFTGLMLADAVQRKEVELDTPVAELMPPGVTVPVRDKVAITLRHLVLHASGLPRLPPSVDPAARDPYGKYTDDHLFKDLIQTELEAAPGEKILYSNFGAGLLGYALGRKAGGGFAAALHARVLAPLELTDTYFTVPADAAARRATPTDPELASVPPWTWTDTLGGAGALSSTARDQLKLVAAELDAATGGTGPLRGAMRFSQEEQLEERPSDNAGLGWLIDPKGRLLHNGGTAGSRAFVAIDPATKRGVVVLASTGSSLVDRLGGILFDVLDNTAKPPGPLPSAAQLASYAGTYDFTGTRLTVVVAGGRLYLDGPGEPRHRLAPVTDVAFWIEPLQAVAFFHEDGGAIKQIVFQIGDRQLIAPRIDGPM
jgi:CubicO group peptidase (beta-lactamase class C family)